MSSFPSFLSDLSPAGKSGLFAGHTSAWMTATDTYSSILPTHFLCSVPTLLHDQSPPQPPLISNGIINSSRAPVSTYIGTEHWSHQYNLAPKPDQSARPYCDEGSDSGNTQLPTVFVIDSCVTGLFVTVLIPRCPSPPPKTAEQPRVDTWSGSLRRLRWAVSALGHQSGLTKKASLRCCLGPSHLCLSVTTPRSLYRKSHRLCLE